MKHDIIMQAHLKCSYQAEKAGRRKETTDAPCFKCQQKYSENRVLRVLQFIFFSKGTIKKMEIEEHFSRVSSVASLKWQQRDTEAPSRQKKRSSGFQQPVT